LDCNLFFELSKTTVAWERYEFMSTYEALMQNVEAAECVKLAVNLPSFAATRPEMVEKAVLKAYCHELEPLSPILGIPAT